MAIYEENISWFCKRHEHTVIASFTDEDVSGGKELRKRPEGEYLYHGLMLKEAEGVVCANVSRMFRDMEDGISTANRFKENGIKMFITDGQAEPIDIDTVQGFTMFTMQLLMAQIELMNIRTRTRNSARFRDRNNMASTHAQYGYDIVDKKQIVNEAEMLVVKEIFAKRDSGIDFKAIAACLNERGVLSKNAGKVVRQHDGTDLVYSGKWSSKTVAGVYNYHQKKQANASKC